MAKISKAFQKDFRAAQQQANDAQKKFGVFNIKKDGTPYKNPNTLCMTREEAEKRASYLTRINTGSEFKVISL